MSSHWFPPLAVEPEQAQQIAAGGPMAVGRISDGSGRIGVNGMQHRPLPVSDKHCGFRPCPGTSLREKLVVVLEDRTLQQAVYFCGQPGFAVEELRRGIR